MESILDLLFDPSKKQRPRRTMIYGGEGIGKTTLGASFPDAVFAPFEDGQRNVSCRSFPQFTSCDAFYGAILSLNELADVPFRTLVIDAVDGLERLIHAFIAKREGKKSIDEIGYGKGFIAAAEMWQEVLNILEVLNTKKNVAIVLLSHAHIERFQSANGDSWDRYGPKLHKHSSPLVREWCDEVLFATHKRYVTEKEAAFGQTKSKAIDVGRVMYTSESASHAAKHRLSGMPDEIAMSFDALASYYPQHGNISGAVVAGSRKTGH